MQITFIGTGSGKASLKRYHSSIVINCDDHILLVDAGDGVSRALLNQKIDPLSIDSILISHFHPDHIGGIASLVNQMIILDRKNPLTIYLHNNLHDAFLAMLNINYLFPEKFNFALNVNAFHSEKEIAVTDKINFISKQNRHLTNKHNIKYMPESAFISSSFLIGLGDNNILYTADIGNEEDIYLFKNQKINLLIAETTHISKEMIFKADEVLNPERTYLIHIDDDDEESLSDFITSQKSTNIFLAYDGLKIRF